MRKGLTQTLLTVAVALLGYQAMSMAPVISGVPDVIIGDAEDNSASNRFVFPDAFNLSSKVTDDSLSSDAVIWSANNVGDDYRINNKPQLGAGDPNAPGASALTSGADDGDQVDTNLQTATFRNSNYSPTPGADGTEPAFTGIGDGQVLTLYASDGTTYSTADIMVYTNNEGFDSLSPTSAPGTEELNVDFGANGPSGWVSYDDLGGGGGGTLSWTSGASGICVSTSANGVNIFGWKSEADAGSFTTVDLTDNAVYRTRVNVSTNATAGNTPLWTVVYGQGQTLYGGNFMFFDNFGSANAPFPNNGSSRQVYEGWTTPSPIATTKWDGAFTGTPLNENGYRLLLRILDVDGAGYGAESDVGQICWKTIEVVRFDYDAIAVDSNVYDVDSFVSAPNPITTPNPNQYSVLDIANNVTEAYGNSISLTETSANTWNQPGPGMFVQITPGDQTFPSNLGDQTEVTAELPDNYPITWEADTLYRISVYLSTPDVTAETNAVDFIFIGMDTVSNELISEGYVTNKYGRIGTPGPVSAPYTLFFYSHSVTAGSFNEFKAFRPKVQIGCNASFIDSTNGGGINVDRVSVDKMTNP